MTDRVTNSDPSTPDMAGESDLVQRSPAAESETIELAFMGTELEEFLRDPAMHGDLADVDHLLASLRDDLPVGDEDVLEVTAARLEAPVESGHGMTFLLTETDIGDLIGDYEQDGDAGLGLEAELLDTFFTEPVALPVGEASLVVIQIEDEASADTAHILS